MTAALRRWLRRWNEQSAVARTAQVGLVCLALWGSTCGEAASIPAAPTPPREGDLDKQAAILRRVQAGEPYYAVFADEAHRRGYATRPPFNFRLPTLTWLLALLPSLKIATFLLVALGTATATLWCRGLLLRNRRRAAGAAIVLSMSMLPFWVSDRAVLFHDLWAGQLIALSLAAWFAGLPALSLVSGASAGLIRELVLAYFLVMAVVTWRAGRGRDAWKWLALLVGIGAVIAAHAAYASTLAPPDALRNRWVVASGPCFVLSTARMTPLLMVVPTWLHACLVTALVIGAYRWTTDAERVVPTVVTFYLGAFLLAGRPDNFYWGLLVAPILPLGALGWRR